MADDKSSRAALPKGLFKATTRLASGEARTYWYAWRGGPRLPGNPGTPEFAAAYKAAVAERQKAPTRGVLAGLVVDYRGSPEFTGNAESTKAEWSRYLDLIQDESVPLAIGGLPVDVLADARVRQHLMAWRDQWRETPRKADYAMQVLSAVLSWARHRGVISTNILIGHGTLYHSDRADQIWTDEEINRFVAAAPSPEVGFIVRLACVTGLRRGDLLRLEWGNVGENAIVLLPSKKRRRSRKPPRKAIIPLLDDTIDLLAEIKRRQNEQWKMAAYAAEQKGDIIPPRPATVLTSTRGRPWTVNGAEHQVVDTKKKACIDKHLHDCRGTFATRLRSDGATTSEIADILGWEEDRVERLLAIYVDKESVVMAFAGRMRAKSAARKQG